MKLSDAILLGSTLLPRDQWRSNDTRGCALGMAMLAVGKTPVGLEEDYQFVRKTWPWLGRFSKYDDPCSRIWLWFDCYVRKGRMTLEQMVDKVREMEPREEEVETKNVETKEEVLA